MYLKKNLGQNILIDKNVVQDLINAAEVSKNDTILEVGAGTGVVTKELAKKAKRVIAVEIDRDFIPILKENLKDSKNVEIINKDILKLELRKLDIRNGAYKIVGSIPYQITSPLIHKLIIEEPKPEVIALIIQKEVAQKITAAPPKATYLSNFTVTTYKAEIYRNVNRGAFEPQPKVDGAIVRLKRYKDTERKRYKRVKDLKRFSKFLHNGFSHPRKMLNKVFPSALLKNVEISPRARAENLSIHNWIALYELVKR